MKVSKIINELNYELVTQELSENEAFDGYTSDLLSDVMGNAPEEQSILITIQAHKNTIAVATLSDITAVLIVNGRQIPKDMLDSAIKENIAIIKTTDNQFISSYKIHKLLFER